MGSYTIHIQISNLTYPWPFSVNCKKKSRPFLPPKKSLKKLVKQFITGASQTYYTCHNNCSMPISLQKYYSSITMQIRKNIPITNTANASANRGESGIMFTWFTPKKPANLIFSHANKKCLTKYKNNFIFVTKIRQERQTHSANKNAKKN